MVVAARLVAVLAPAAILVASVLGLSADFVARLGTAPLSDPMPRTAIVFTGQFDRIRAGLDLLAAGRVDKLLISGVNRAAGLDPGQFAEAFDLSPGLRTALATGDIVLGVRAGTTLQNAEEASCWLAHRAGVHDAVLVTSARHMPRASLALQRALPAGFRIVRFASDAEHASDVPGALTSREFGKFLVTSVITLLPRAVWERARIPDCDEMKISAD